eukprot:gene1351-1368_t
MTCHWPAVEYPARPDNTTRSGAIRQTARPWPAPGDVVSRKRGTHLHRKYMRLSAYMSIFDDWDMLPDALAAVSPFADEIVIVDGAYCWMAPMLRASGRDPEHSMPEVAACLAPYAHKLRIVSGLWEDEMEKRSAGYAACQGRYVLRFDADEIMFLTEALIEAAIARGYPVASVEMPTYALPGWICGHPREDGSLGDIERQCVFFDRSRIGVEEHLSYLWLVLGNAEKARLGQPDAAKIDPVPLAYNAHLTCWRTPQTSVHRARFYVMNWMRDAGTIPWLGGITARQEDGFAAFFAAMPPHAFRSLLLGHEIVAGQPGFGRWVIRAAPSNPVHDPAIGARFEAFVRSLAELNRTLAADGRLMLSDMPCCIDLSTPAALAALAPDGNRVTLRFDQAITACRATLLRLDGPRDGIGHGVTRPLHVEIAGDTVVVSLPERAAGDQTAPLRQTLVVVASADPARKLLMTGVAGGAAAISVEEARAATVDADWPLAVRSWQAVLDSSAESEEALLRLGEALLHAGRQSLDRAQLGDVGDVAAALGCRDRALPRGWRRPPA